MCTALYIQSPQKDAFFGRTMDFSYPLSPEMYFIPKGYTWNNLMKTHKIHNQYRIMGIGQNISPVILADGVNEKGFAAAALYFPGYAQYDPIVSQDAPRISIAALELVNLLLGQCDSVSGAASMLRMIRIVGVKDSVTDSVAPLHWILADRSGKCMVVEKTADGLHLYNNPIGVFANSPDFQWHMTNLRNYMNVTPPQKQNAEWNDVKLTPFGQGTGTFGLPGDYTPPSRFVRTAFQKSHAMLPDKKEEALLTCFHLMESVSIPKGIVMTDKGTADYTQYTAFIDLSETRYYFRTYDNSQIAAVKLPAQCDCTSKILSLGKLARPLIFDSLKNTAN